MKAGRLLVWYSDGAASAVAARLAVQKYGERCEVLKCDTTVSEHPDNVRFRHDVERWIGRPVTLLHSPAFANVDEVFERTRYMAGVAGARCTVELKKAVRQRYERPDDLHIFGYTADETKRVKDFEGNNPGLVCEWVLVERGITKADCYQILADAGLQLPAMYALPAYWNRVRRLFPDVFERRAQQSREIGARLVRVAGVRVFLDELPEEVGAGESDGNIECGPYCEVPEQGSLNWWVA